MKGGRIILIAGILLAVLAGLMVLALFNMRTPTKVEVPTPEPPTVLRAAQNISKGDDLSLEVVQLVRLQTGEAVPPSFVKDPMQLVGMTAALDIPQGTVIQQEMFYNKKAMAEAGQNASQLFLPGRVAVAVPVDSEGIASAIRPGDHVDIIASFEVAQVDQNAQIVLPLDGKKEQTPRMVVQLTLQNLEILRVGAWGAPVAQVAATASAGASGKSQSPTPAASTVADTMTMLMSQQDALVFQFLLEKVGEGQAHISMVLRSEDDDKVVETESVTLDYLTNRFKIVSPTKLGDTTMQIPEKSDIQAK